MDYNNINALVCGMAKSGIAAAGLLKKCGAAVTLQDLKTEDKLNAEDIACLKAEGISLYLGKNPDDILSDFSLMVLSPGIPTDLPFILKAKEMGIKVIGEIELAYSLCPAPVIGITGTNGKTTTTTLVGEIMKAHNENTAVVGNIGTPYADYALTIGEKGCIVAELSSFQLESIESFHPHISAVLNITPDHLNRHKTLEGYIAAKENIFINQTEADFAVLNYNDPATKAMAGKTKAKTIYFSLMGKCKEGVYSDEKSIYINCLGINQKIVDIDELKILGDHNVENAMSAVAMALCAGVPVETIRKVLIAFKAVEHRIEYVTTANGVDYYNDSKGTNPDASIKAVLAMKKPICLIAGGYDKGSDFTEWVELFEGRVKYVAVIGAVKAQLAETLDKVGFTKYEVAETFEEAFNLCVKNAVEGDCVLLSPACASWDMFKSFEQRGEIFKDLALKLNC